MSLFRAAALIALLAPTLALAESKTVSYTILKEGDPIGKETYMLDRDEGHTSVALTVDSAVRILFLDFRYHHTRTESWNEGKLEKLSADTDDDGTKHHVEVAADPSGAGFTVTSDGKAVNVPPDAFPLAQWNNAMLNHPVLIAVESDDAPYKVAFKKIGQETLTIGGQPLETEHYMMSGDVERDLWYDDEGILAKVTFRRRGFGIAIVRDN